MKSTLTALLSFAAILALSGCNELCAIIGGDEAKGVYTGQADAPLDQSTRDALGKRAAHQNFGL